METSFAPSVKKVSFSILGLTSDESNMTIGVDRPDKVLIYKALSSYFKLSR